MPRRALMRSILTTARILAAIGLCVIFLSTKDVQAQTITLGVTSQLSIGNIEYATNHSGTVEIGTNGGVILTGTGLSYSGSANPGVVTVTTASTSRVLEIRCAPNATLVGNNGRNLTINPVRISINTGQPPGVGGLCSGKGAAAGNAAVVDLALTPNPTILIGGLITIANNRLRNGTTFTTTTNPIDLRVVYQ